MAKRANCVIEMQPDFPPKKRQKMDSDHEDQEGMHLDITITGTRGKKPEKQEVDSLPTHIQGVYIGPF